MREIRRNKIARFLSWVVLVTVLVVQSHAQVKSKEENIYIDPRLDEFVLDYVVEAHRRGLSVDSIIAAEVKAIILVNFLKYPILGFYNTSKQVIYINEHMLVEDIIVRRIIYHELGHALTEPQIDPHVCYGCNAIMAATAPPSFYYLIDDENWQRELDEYFEWLCENIKK